MRGLATQKQTNMLLRTWHARPHFPRLAAFCKSADGFTLPAAAKIGGNISLFIGELEESAVRTLQRTCGIHVYPSAVEGFGHALNEARAASAVLVTTGYPPMSDLVEDGVSGILIRTHEADRFLFRTGAAIGVRETELAAAIERVLAMSIDERRTMGRAARGAFLAGQSAFHDAIGTFVAERL
jgi:glycosyltransferase involved in cell wall biosynthesis